jgi:hypothetical protein
MTIAELVHRYEEGGITPLGLVLAVFNQINRDNVDEVMQQLPPWVYPQMQRFVDQYRPEMRVFNAQKPSSEAVALGAEWLRGRPADESGGRSGA